MSGRWLRLPPVVFWELVWAGFPKWEWGDFPKWVIFARLETGICV